MTRDEIAKLVTDLREMIEERITVDLAPLAAIRLEQRLFEALAHGRSNVFRLADRAQCYRNGVEFPKWK